MDHGRTYTLLDSVLGAIGNTPLVELSRITRGLDGRILALDEVDETAERWRAHVALQLSLHDSRTGATVWSATYDRSEPMHERNPEGLARALSEVLARIVVESAPALAAQTRAARGEPLAAEALRP